MSSQVSGQTAKPAPLPPRWLIRSFWVLHRAIYAISSGRRGLRRPTQSDWGMMQLTTTGRRSGLERNAILAYFEDGPNIITMAMNGWGDAEPAWWLNMQAAPDVTVQLPDRMRAVRGRAATAEERPRLWAQWAIFNGPNQESWAARRSRETAIVILEPRTEFAPPGGQRTR